MSEEVLVKSDIRPSLAPFRITSSKHDRLVTQTIQQWSNQSDWALRHCFSAVECCVFQDNNINTYTGTVIGCIDKCINEDVPRFSVQTFLNQKCWVNGEVNRHLQVKWFGEVQEVWAGLRTITDYKRKTSSAEVMSASLPDEVYVFARFESHSPSEEVQKDQDPSPPVISGAEVCRYFKRINPCEASGPAGIPG